MSFQSGRVSFCRYAVQGDSPESIQQELLDKLAEHAFTDSPIGAPSEVEAGWVSGDHLYDQQFAFEKNVFGNLLLFALRMDTHRVPSDVKYAYRRSNEQALAAANPSGFLSRSQKKEVRELVDRQIQEELASGKYRRSKQVFLVWDIQATRLYCSSSGSTVQEHLCRRFRETFGLELSLLTAGSLARDLAQRHKAKRSLDDLRPTALTAAPASSASAQSDSPSTGETPSVPWTTASNDVKDFLGNEFLIWLWYQTEHAGGSVNIATDSGQRAIGLAIDKSLDMDCAWGLGGKQSLRGGAPTQMIEARHALASGKWPRKASLILADGQNQWELGFQADRWLVSSALLPEILDVETPRDLLDQRLQSTRELAGVLDGLYLAFLLQRADSPWDSLQTAMRKWIAQRVSR